MKLDRNTKGCGKYGLIKIRRIQEIRRIHGKLPEDITDALQLLVDREILDWGATPETEFFVMRLKDRFAAHALRGYAVSANACGEYEFAREVTALSRRSEQHPHRKIPD